MWLSSVFKIQSFFDGTWNFFQSSPDLIVLMQCIKQSHPTAKIWHIGLLMYLLQIICFIKNMIMIKFNFNWGSDSLFNLPFTLS